MGHPSSNRTTIEYTFQCYYHDKPWYSDWRVKVCIERKSVSGVKWASQPVKVEDRYEEHKNDFFVIKVPADGSLLHSDDTATCSRGAHPMFVSATRDCPEMLAWSRNQIKSFIAQRHITDPVETLSHCIKKSNESARRGQVQADLSPGTKQDTLGALFAAAHGMSFASVLQKQGTAFNWNTVYIVPGSVVPESTSGLADGDKTGEKAFFCLMFTTFRLILEYYVNLALREESRFRSIIRSRYTLALLMW